MKRFIAIILAAALLLGMTACGDPVASTPNTGTGTTQSTPAPTTDATVPTEAPTQPPVTVTVTLDPNGGECDQTQLLLTQGECYGVLPAPSLEGYVFQGWFTQAEDGEQITEETLLTADADHTLYAHWQVQTAFTVTLDANGGRISSYISQVTVTAGEAYGTLPEPIREGYEFKGWYTAPENGTKIKSTTQFTGAENVTLYAHWTYDAYAYWSYVLQNTVEQIPQCRRVVVYLERNASRKTYIDCPFLDDAGAINPAEGLDSIKVTDEWISSVQPWVIVKLCSSMSEAMLYKMAMEKRFPRAEIYIFSTNAISGKQESQLYYRLALAKLLYPEYFEDVDLTTVKKELGISPKVYY